MSAFAGYDEDKNEHRGSNGAAERMRFIPWAELSSLPKRQFLIKGLLDSSAMSVVYGASGCGKTFFVLDLAAHVALGLQYRGRKLCQGAVLYVAAEGGLGIEERLRAFQKHHGINTAGVMLLVLPASIDMCRSPIDTDEIIATARAMLGDRALVLIVIDTLSRVLTGGNENAPDDMGAFVGNCDRLRKATGAHLLVIHHTGKEQDRGARGHSLLRAAADTEIEVIKDETGLVTATMQKQRDYSSGDRFLSRLRSVEIDLDEDGEPITSCVVELVDDTGAATKAKPKKISAAARQALDLLHEAMITKATEAPTSEHVPAGVKGVTKSVWRAYCEKGGIINPEGSPREQLRRIVVTLKDAGFIGVWDDFVWPVTQRHKASL